MSDHSELFSSGNTRVYVPEFFHDDKWRRVPMRELTGMSSEFGVPYERGYGGLHQQTGTFSKHQALALAHIFAAQQIAACIVDVKVRVAEYELVYSYSVKRIVEEETKT